MRSQMVQRRRFHAAFEELEQFYNSKPSACACSAQGGETSVRDIERQMSVELRRRTRGGIWSNPARKNHGYRTCSISALGLTQMACMEMLLLSS